MSKVLTIKDAAQALGLHPKTLRRWEEKGKFTPRRTLGNQRRFSDSDVNLLAKLKAGETVPPPRPRLLTLEQAAAKLQVSPATVSRWTKEGKLRIAVNDQLQPGYNEAEIRQHLQGQSLKATERPVTPQEPTRSNLVGLPTRTVPNVIVKYAGIAGLALALGILAYLWLRPQPVASPAVLEAQTQTVDLALPRTAQFLDGRITLGLASGDLFYADAAGNLYLKNNALIDQGVYTHRLQLLPSAQPAESQIGQLYVDQSSGNLQYFDGLDWISLNQIASPAAANALQTATESAQWQTINSILTGSQFIDTDQTTYYLDPSSANLSLSLAGEASISSTLKFTKFGEFITNSVDDYLIFSGGIGVGGASNYGFSAGQNLSARSANLENELTVAGKVAIGTDVNSNYKLKVNGNVYVAGDITTESNTYPDYVFEPDYPLLSPLQLEEFVTTQKHLPGVPSLAEVEAQGLNLKQLLLALLEKTEENTLYLLDLYDRLGRVETAGVLSPLSGGQVFISGDATVSGTLYASQIESSTIERLREKIKELAENLTLETASAPEATITAILDTPPASPAGALAEAGHLALTSLEADAAFFKDYLAVLGQTTLTNVNINDRLLVNTISSLAGPLTLLGLVSVSGNLAIAGALEVAQINIATGSALAIYSQEEPLATFSGQTVALANLKLEASGIATIAAGTNNSLVPTGRLTNQSQVIVTFTSDYTPATKFWVKKEPAFNQFTVFVNYPVNNDTALDWLIIN